MKGEEDRETERNTNKSLSNITECFYSVIQDPDFIEEYQGILL